MVKRPIRKRVSAAAAGVLNVRMSRASRGIKNFVGLETVASKGGGKSRVNARKTLDIQVPLVNHLEAKGLRQLNYAFGSRKRIVKQAPALRRTQVENEKLLSRASGAVPASQKAVPRKPPKRKKKKKR